MRALLSVSDKTGIVEFAKGLARHNIGIVSTGGTFRILQENGIKAKEISEKLVNFKNAPYLENLKYLSAYNHWDPIQTNILNDTNNNRFYARTLNLLLCISLDFLNLQYRIRGIDKSRPSNFIKAVNLIFYSSQ